MTVKKAIGTLHLWLGLASGLVVFVISLTGCILAFEQEIRQATEPFRYVQPPANGQLLPPSVLKARAEAALPGKKASGILYEETGKSANVGFYQASPEYYYQVYLNPYTGEVLKIWNEDDDFFHFILHGHYYLWLSEKIGQPVAASGTLIFLFMLLSGLVLWWPKSKNAAKQRFSVNWKAAWRRRNYDLHNVFGFYVLALGMLFAVTGLVWGFEWFSQGLYRLTGGTGSAAYVVPPSDTTATPTVSSPITAVDRVWQQLRRDNPTNRGMNLSFPLTRDQSIYSYVNFRPGTYYRVDYHYFDQHTLKEIPVNGPYGGTYASATFANKLRRMNYDIHVGAIWGLAGKILAFGASLVCASLPVTGFLIWWGRRKKKRPATRNRPSAGGQAAPQTARSLPYRKQPVQP